MADELHFPLTFFIAALYLGVLCTVIGYVLWFRALIGLTASSTGSTLYFEPIVTVFFAWLLLGQTIGWITALGGVLVMLGVIMVSRG
jgi:drug/metabolite transporter (DMT)-like permease